MAQEKKQATPVHRSDRKHVCHHMGHIISAVVGGGIFILLGVSAGWSFVECACTAQYVPDARLVDGPVRRGITTPNAQREISPLRRQYFYSST